MTTGAITVLIGVLHLIVGFRSYDRLDFDALWFAGSGLAVLLIGALTMLGCSRHAWGSLRLTAVVANLLGLTLAVGFGALTRWREPQGPILSLLFAAGACGMLARRHADRVPL